MLKAIHLTCEHLHNPVGVTGVPRFSWRIESPARGIVQIGRRLQVSGDNTFAKCLWDSGDIPCGECILVPYAGPRLAPQTRYWWRVKVWDARLGESDWSDPASFVTALEKWRAPFISAEAENSGASSAGTLLRGEFQLRKGIKSAIVNATAHGVYVLSLNGLRVSDWAMTPGWTEYNSRLLYQSHDVTSLLHEGANAAGAMLGNGWYKGDLASWIPRRNVYGSRTAFSMELTVTYDDGSRETFMTGPAWQAGASPVLYSEIYHGETYDATKLAPGWDTAGFAATDWRAAEVVAADAGVVVPQDGVPVRPHEVLPPVKVFTAPNGEQIVDFGQNITGWVWLKVKGKAGEVVRYSHAEALDKDGNFYTGNLRRAKQRIQYTLRGGADEFYEPHFTFQGFRYIRIDAFPGEFKADNFAAVAVHSDLPRVGSFHCSNEKLNQLMQNIRWSMKDNFLDVPTDCPQRDERLGWTGDAQVFVRAASFLYETAAFFRKWLRDVAAAQFPDGGIPHVVPDVLTGFVPEGDIIDVVRATTGWGDVGVVAPWTVYKHSGDKRLLEESYPMMQGWVEFIRSRAQDGLIWNSDKQLGDWVALDAKEGSYFGATPVDLVATAYYAYSTALLAKAAALLGRDAEAREYFQLRERIGAAFVKEFFTPNGRLSARTQTGHILALYFGLVPPEFRRRSIDTLVEILGEYDNHLSTGFLGTPYICYALSENGRLDLAYELLQKEDYPSWLYPLSKGATTIWEHWDGIKPDGSMWSDNMNSFNHYAYGAVADWMYSVIGGLDTEEQAAGFKRSRIHPRPGGGLTSAKVAEITPYGELSSAWWLEGGRMTLEVAVPHNTAATVILPAGKIVENAGLKFTFNGGGQAALAPSGAYRFVVEGVEA